MRLSAVVAVAVLARGVHADPCEEHATSARLGALLHAHRYADAHHAAVSARVICGESETWRLVDDIALLRLEDRPAALVDLDGLARGAAPTAITANLVLGWAYLGAHDDAAAQTILPRLPAPRAAALQTLAALGDEDAFADQVHRLPPELAQRAAVLGDRYHEARGKHPALAGVMSAILPGSGQLYAGSPQAAVVTFVLNALFIGATVELALDHQYITASAAGTAASFFYVGGVMNAVDLARRRNQVASQPYADQLESLLVPELDGSFTR